MTVTLALKPEAEAQLVAQAKEQGLPVETYLSRVVERLLTGVLDEEPDYIEEEPPIIPPKVVGRITGRLVYGGRLAPLPVNEEDWVDHDA